VKTKAMTISIHNADPSEHGDIQAIVNAHGFGILIAVGNHLEAVSPDALNAGIMAAVENDLLDDVGKHLGVAFR
jgi:hypothetical protein